MIDITSHRIGDVTVFGFNGRMDSSSRLQLMALVDHEIVHDHREIVLNLSGVNYISTSGLKMLRRVYETKGHVRIAEPSARVRELLTVTGLEQTYLIYSTQAEAIHTITPVINAHTHLELGWLDAYRPGPIGQDFMEWMREVIFKRRDALGDRANLVYEEAAEFAIQRLIDMGTTTVCDVTRSGLSIGPLLQSGLRGVVYLGFNAINPEQGAAELARVRGIIDTWRRKEHSGMKIGLAPHAPYSIIPQMWGPILKYAVEEDLPLSIHVAESTHEVSLLRDGTGPMQEHNQAIGMDAHFPVPQQSPIAYLESVGALDRGPMLVHAVQVDDDDIQRIKSHHCIVVHCPRSNLRLRCGRMPLEKFVAAEIPVYLGTDSLGSSPTLNVIDDMECAIALHHGRVEPAVIERMVHQPLPFALV